MEHVKELIEALPGVEFVHITCNRTYDYDNKSQLPAHSIKVYVLGGKKKQIAYILWMNKPVGIMMLGNTKVNVSDSGGYRWPVTFERLL